jgi:hypothetical protein
MIIVVIGRHGVRTEHRCSDELTGAEVLERFGLKDRAYQVSWYPEGHPEAARILQDMPR